MFQLIEVMERLQQLLSLLDVLHKSGCLQAVLQNPLLQEPKLGLSEVGIESQSAFVLKILNLGTSPPDPCSSYHFVFGCGAIGSMVKLLLKALLTIKDTIRWRPSQVGWRPSLLVTRSY
ncbi:unnamed protein product [Durusdinium trenchii]|uniref:Uncharacterized protein n=1 Tax=Durusdinium trenchii TaxID=1381693 RepID=A0ABP0PTT5_9DINO